MRAAVCPVCIGKGKMCVGMEGASTSVVPVLAPCYGCSDWGSRGWIVIDGKEVREMAVHQVTDKSGRTHMVHTGHMNYWVCVQCGYPCGYTWTTASTVRHAFCRVCDSVERQVAMNNRGSIE